MDGPDKPHRARAGDAALAWFADFFARPFSDIAVATRMSGQQDLSHPATLGEALATVGLKSTTVRRRLARIDPIVLPCVLFEKDGMPLILTGIDRKTRRARWVTPGETGTDEAPMADLQRRVTREIMLVTPEDTSDAEAAAAARRAGHWFWAPVRAHWPSWAQVMLASLLLNLMALALPLFIMNVYDKVIPNLSFVTLWTLAIGVGLAVCADLALRTIRMATIETISQRIDLKVGASLYRHALDLGLLTRPGGAAGLAGQIREYETVRDFFASSTFVSFFDLLFIALFLGVLYAIVGPLALLPALAVPVVLVFALIARAAISNEAQAALRLAGRRQTVLMESLRGVETIKTLNAEGRMQREWETAIAATARVNGRARFWSNLSTNATLFIQQCVSVGIIVWGVYLIFDGRITIGALIAASILSGRALAPLTGIAQATFRLQYVIKAMRSLNAMMALQGDKPRTVRSHLKVRHAALNLTDVTFAYPGAQVPAISGLSLEVAPGECLALLGRVGSGKTTLGKLLCGLIEPQTGIIRVDGFGLNQYDRAELRAGIGYLPQTGDLFTGTLRDNLLLANPGADQARIEKALYYSGLGDFVAASPGGLEMQITENGGSLSGGQAQALALARVLLKDARLLFLDEPTNAMDQEMERVVCARLKALNAEGVTLILCTHRQSLANIADRFVILETGRKVLDGSRDAVTARLRDNEAARVAAAGATGGG
ncbi:MAG: type I secretion system permease/ATPase [Rhodobacteraceae bacterium]|nr:type I secretion system permease/ATPase [Paracoccaceae bacterium]